MYEHEYKRRIYITILLLHTYKNLFIKLLKNKHVKFSYYVPVLLLIATWKRKSWLLKTWMAITSVCTFSDLRSVLFDLMVGSIDIGLAFAVISLVGNLGCLVTVFYFERHLVEEKARVFQQTWITTDETRKNGGFESDADTEDAEEIQV